MGGKRKETKSPKKPDTGPGDTTVGAPSVAPSLPPDDAVSRAEAIAEMEDYMYEDVDGLHECWDPKCRQCRMKRRLRQILTSRQQKEDDAHDQGIFTSQMNGVRPLPGDANTAAGSQECFPPGSFQPPLHTIDDDLLEMEPGIYGSPDPNELEPPIVKEDSSQQRQPPQQPPSQQMPQTQPQPQPQPEGADIDYSIWDGTFCEYIHQKHRVKLSEQVYDDIATWARDQLSNLGQVTASSKGTKKRKGQNVKNAEAALAAMIKVM